MSMKQLPTGEFGACYEIKPNGDGRYYFDAFGFKSRPFDMKDMRQNKEWFSQVINSKAEGTVQ